MAGARGRRGVRMIEDKKVVSLAERRPGAAPAAEAAAVRIAWDNIRNGRLMPARADLTPAMLGRALPGAFLVEKIGPGMARFRVAGSRLVHLAGAELRLMPLSAIFAHEARADLADVLHAVFEEPARVRLELEPTVVVAAAGEPPALDLLPLAGADGPATFALGHLSGVPGFAQRPERYAIVGQSRRTLIGYAKPPAADPQGRRPSLTLVPDPA